jgi:uncharacterized DUF497 family protein
MTSLRFIWGSQKAKANKLKHRVTFAEAETVFYDDDAMEFADPDHSEVEDRFIILGMSAALRVLVVCYCYPENESTIRIISARKATRKETRFYGEHDR